MKRRTCKILLGVGIIWIIIVSILVIWLLTQILGIDFYPPVLGLYSETIRNGILLFFILNIPAFILIIIAIIKWRRK